MYQKDSHDMVARQLSRSTGIWHLFDCERLYRYRLDHAFLMGSHHREDKSSIRHCDDEVLMMILKMVHEVHENINFTPKEKYSLPDEDDPEAEHGPLSKLE